VDILNFFRTQSAARKRQLHKIEQHKMPPSPNNDTPESIAELLGRVSRQTLQMPSAAQTIDERETEAVR
jgi:hypothetical protein